MNYPFGHSLKGNVLENQNFLLETKESGQLRVLISHQYLKLQETHFKIS